MKKRLQSDIGQKYEEEIPFVGYDDPITDDDDDFDYIDTNDYYE